MIRFGEKKDAPQVVDLIMIILKDMELSIFQEIEEDEIHRLLEEAFLLPKYRYGYTRCLVYEKENNIAGVAFGYPASDEPTIDDPLQEVLRKNGYEKDIRLFTDPETKEGEWYLDSIATSPKYRGQGIGSELLDALPQLAKQKGYDWIGLNVDEANPRAKKLYLSKGFKAVDKIMISGHLYEHLQKNIIEK